jgi:drug/metabolite transporter (DMT)-like permease
VARPSTADLGLIAVAVTGVSASGPLIAAMAVPALAIAFWRNLMASALLVPLALVRQRAALRGLSRREWAVLVAAGGFLALHFATWIPSVRLTGVASSTTLVASQPVWSALIARRQGQHVPRGAWLGIGLAVLGVAFVSGVDVTVSRDAVVGDLLAVLGGALAAAYMTTGAAARRTVSTTVYTSVCYASCALILLPMCVIGGASLGGYSGTDWWRLVALTALAQLLGHSVFNRVLKTTSPTVVSLSILFEGPGAALMAAVFLSQYPRWIQLPGLLLLLAGVAVVIRSSRPGQPGDAGQGIPAE